MFAGPPLHFNGALAGFIDLLLAEWTDHLTDLSGGGASRTNEGVESGFPYANSRFAGEDHWG